MTEATRNPEDGQHEQPDPVRRVIEAHRRKQAARNAPSGVDFGPVLEARFDVSKVPRRTEPEPTCNDFGPVLEARFDVSKVPRRTEPEPTCNAEIVSRLKRTMKLLRGEKPMMNGKRNTLPPVHILEDTWLEPPPPKSNGKPPIFAELNGVALGLWDFDKPEQRKRMMEEAASLLDRGFVPGAGFALENDKASVMMFDSVRYKQLRPTLTPLERTQERFDLWQQDQLAFGEVVAGEVKPAAEEAVS
jgi:hypothetical protein